MQPQRLMVPLFQRPYVWNQENQWEPLWEDVVRLAERSLKRPDDKPQPHFIGAVVLQQVPHRTGEMPQHTIIDGQQRLTTLQLLLDALHAELRAVNAELPAERIEQLIANPRAYCARPEDRFKVWPTNRDRPAFNAVMAAPPPVDHDAVGHTGERMVEAHRFFSQEARKWLQETGGQDTATRAAALETVVREHLQMVVIDLGVAENAQEIFETLNARGAQLTAADLIKNFIFQRLLESKANVEEAYENHWKAFETGFWETEINLGRVRYPRSAIFLNHWLIARTAEAIVAREVFTQFKTFADYDSGEPMGVLLRQIQRAAEVYRDFTVSASAPSGLIDRVGLFGYRTGVLESEVIKPLILQLRDPEQPPIPPDQLTKALDAIESWMVRRMLVRATTKAYNQFVADVVAEVRGTDREKVGDVIETFLARQTGASRYWPDDKELRDELRTLMIYRRLSRGRLRMVLEAIEDYQRGWRGKHTPMGEERVARGKLAIEHVMPRKWTVHWPPGAQFRGEAERDQIIHTLGNLTLLNGRLNSKMSNGPWLGVGGKREGLEGHSVLFLNRGVLRDGSDAWSEETIRARTDALVDMVIAIWPVPAGHRSGFVEEKAPARHHKVDLADLISSGKIAPGTCLFPRRKKYADRAATVLPDGQIDIDGTTFPTPSAAGASITGKPTNGWWFFLVDQATRRSLKDVRREYVDAHAVDADEEEADDEDDDDAA